MSATYIAGIASNGAWDTAGESIDIKGMDISSLEGAVLNFEHKSEKTSDYVGKILKAKKIFKIEDCSNDIELKYWNKCGIPFLFCLGVLFDEYQPAAKECAAIFEFDFNNPTLPPTLGFSIEGAKLNKENGVITNSIARKLTITSSPANKTCLAGKVDMEVAQVQSDPLATLFKNTEIELSDFETLKKSMPMQPKAPQAPAAPAAAAPAAPKPVGLKQAPPKMPKAGLKQPSADKGSVIGHTNAGHEVFSKEKVHNYTHFNAEDHRNASVIHTNAAQKANAAKDYKSADHHNQKKKLHDQAAAGEERKANRFSSAVNAKNTKNGLGLNKALTASGGMVAPGELTGGAALQGVKVDKKNLTKSEWLARASEEYKNWDKREDFEKFVKSRLPRMVKSEIEALGRVFILKKSVDMEKSLETMLKGHKEPTKK